MNGELAVQCLELARHLALTSQSFKLSLKLISPNSTSTPFSFQAESGFPTLPGTKKNDTRKERKKKSPPTQRRDKERKERYLRKKESHSTSPVIPASPSHTFHEIAPTGIPQWEGNYTITEDDNNTAGTGPEEEITNIESDLVLESSNKLHYCIHRKCNYGDPKCWLCKCEAKQCNSDCKPCRDKSTGCMEKECIQAGIRNGLRFLIRDYNEIMKIH